MYLIRDGHRAGGLKPHLALLHALTFCPTGIQLDFERVFFPQPLTLIQLDLEISAPHLLGLGTRKNPTLYLNYPLTGLVKFMLVQLGSCFQWVFCYPYIQYTKVSFLWDLGEVICKQYLLAFFLQEKFNFKPYYLGYSKLNPILLEIKNYTLNFWNVTN